MEGTDLLRFIDSIHREKGISKELLFESIEQALLTASRKRFGAHGELNVKINRFSGDIEAYEDGRRMDPNTFGRIPAQTAKQIMIKLCGEFSGAFIRNKPDALNIIPRIVRVFHALLCRPFSLKGNRAHATKSVAPIFCQAR